MNFDAALPLLVVASSLLPGLVIFFLRESSHGLRTALNLGGAGLKLLLNKREGYTKDHLEPAARTDRGFRWAWDCPPRNAAACR